MKPGQIRPLYLEPRLHKQSVKQKINNHGTCLARPLHTLYTQKNVWQTIGPPSMRLLSAMTSISRKKSDSTFVTDCLFTSPSSKPFTRFEF
jgi:hypothetical protein